MKAQGQLNMMTEMTLLSWRVNAHTSAAIAANVTVATLGGHPETHILGETFYSQAPVLFGDFIANRHAEIEPKLKINRKSDVCAKPPP